MKSTYKILILLLSIATLVSCEDEDKDFFQGFTEGSFIRFVDETPPLTIVAEDNSSGFSLTIEDVNENTQSYSIDVVATLAGVQSIAENAITITSFPAQLTVTAESLANIFNVDPSSIGGGDNFVFRGTAVRNDGVEFSWERPTFTAATDTEPATLTGGNISDNLVNGPGYRNAMLFNFTYACPDFTRADALGTYSVTVDDFGLANSTFEVSAGPTANSVTITGLFTQPFNVDVDPVTGEATIARQPVEDAFFGYSGGNVNSNPGTSFMFSCSGSLAFAIQYTVDAGSFGTSALAGKKN